jgi:gluconolactonase
LFSDPNANTIYRYAKDGKLSVFKTPSGYSGADIAEYGQPGSNGLTLDPAGRLVVDQHGDRRVVRLEKDGSETVLADHYEGKRLNSPNDLVYRSDGTLFFTDPPFGLPKFSEDKRKELPFSGVYSLHKGKLQLVTKDLAGPNGIAFSPDEKYLYVTNWDEKRKVIMRYEVQVDGTLRNGRWAQIRRRRYLYPVQGLRPDAGRHALDASVDLCMVASVLHPRHHQISLVFPYAVHTGG